MQPEEEDCTDDEVPSSLEDVSNYYLSEEVVIPRRSGRNRRAPVTLQYPALGEPVVQKQAIQDAEKIVWV